MKLFLGEEDGATAIEYSILAALVSIVIVGGLTIVGTKLSTTFSSVGTKVGN